MYITDIVNNMTLRQMIIEYLDFYSYQSFSEFDEIHKDQIVADLMGFITIDEDLLETHAKASLIGYLTTYDQDQVIDFLNHTKQFLYNYFASSIDEVLTNEVIERQHESYREAGLRPVIDNINGETLWRKI